MDFPISPKKSSSLWIEIERRNEVVVKPKTEEAEDSTAVLLLTHFAETPRLSFGRVAIDKVKEVTLIVKNPLEYSQIVVVEKVPEKKGFTTDLVYFEIQPSGEKPVKIVWAPSKPGNYRELITFRVDALFYKQAILLGSAVAPPKRILQAQNRGETTETPAQKIKKKPVKNTITKKKCTRTDENRLQMTYIQRKNVSGLRNLTELNSDQAPELKQNLRNQSKLASSPKATVYLRLTPDLQLRSTSSQPEPILSSVEENAIRDRRQTYTAQPHRARQLLISPQPSSRSPPDSFESRGPFSESDRRTVYSGNRGPLHDHHKSRDEIDRRQTYTKDEVPYLMPTQTPLSPESCLKLRSPSSPVSSGKRSKIPEPIYKLKSKYRRHSDASDLNDSLDGDRLNDFSSCTTDDSETKPSSAGSIADCEFKSQISTPPFFPNEQSLQITELDYNDFCGVLSRPQNDWEELSENKPPVEYFEEDDEEEEPYRIKCSTEMKPIARICNVIAVDSRKELFPSESEEAANRMNSETFVMGQQSAIEWKDELPLMQSKRKSRKKSGIPSLTFQGSVKRDDGEKEKLKVQIKPRRNRSKTSESGSSKDSKERTQSRKKKGLKQNTSIPQFDSAIAYRPKLTLIKPPSVNKTLTPSHPNPYAAKNIYYDEQWIEKQTQGFTRWLNFILTIPDELGEGEKHKIAANAALEFNRDATFKQAPSREELSIRAYTATKKMNILRRKACHLYQSEGIVKVITRLEHEIENRRITIRSDKALHADVGIKQKLLDLVMNYNNLWLKIGLETVFGRIINIKSNDDSDGLHQFLLNNLLNNPVIAKEYAHATVPHLFKPGYATALKKHTLKKFLLLVYFLDQAKENYLIDFNPCLFKIDAKFKTSRDVLLTFSRDHLSGEGDITKHLAYFGYKVTYSQTALDEYDFSVTNLAVDLRNGLRIARAAQLLTQNWCLMTKLRVPAVTRMQKIHNVTCVLNVLAENSVIISDVTAKDIVNGHREKTLSLLWQFMFNFQVKLVLCEHKLKAELQVLEKSLKSLEIDLDKYINNYDKVFPDEKVELLLRWCQLVCAHYKIAVDNFTVSFSDGRVLCYLVHHYYPELLPSSEIHDETTQSYLVPTDSLTSDDSFNEKWTSSLTSAEKQEQLLKNEQENFRVALSKIVLCGGVPLMIKPSFMSNTIPDEKVTMVFISYLCARYLDFSAELRAARVIQKAWRKHSNKSQSKREKQMEIEAAIKIQRAIRKHFHRPQMNLQTESSIKIQRWLRTHLLRQRFLKTRRNIVRIQALARRFIARQKFLRLQAATLIIQTWFRMQQARIQYQAVREFIQQREIKHSIKAAITIQRSVRIFLLKKHQLENEAASIIQRAIRNYLARIKMEEDEKLDLLLREAERDAAATSIQSFWRMVFAKKNYNKLKIITIKIQAYFKGQNSRDLILKKINAIYTIQRWYRRIKMASKIREDFLECKRSALIIQNWFRSWKEADLVRKEYLELKLNVMKMQILFRRTRDTKQQRMEFLAVKCAVINLQQWYRNVRKTRAFRSRFNQTKQAVICIENWYIGTMQTRFERENFLALRMIVIRLQQLRRSVVAMKKLRMEYLILKEKAVIIQRWFRCCREAQKCRIQFLELKNRVLFIQRSYRQIKQVKEERSRFLQIKEKVIILQKRYRMRKLTMNCRAEFIKQKNSAISIQRWYRSKKLSEQIRRQFLVKRRATIHIQKWYRCMKETKRIHQQFLKLEQTVIFVQRLYRRSKESRNTRLQYLKTIQSVIIIQRWYRECKVIQKTRDDYLKMVSAVMMIQQRLRSRNDMRKRRSEFLAIRNAAVNIQSWFTRCKQSKSPRLKFLKLRQAAIIIQRRYRQHLEIKRQREEISVCKELIFKIQTWYKCCKEMKRVRGDFLRVKQAVIIIQSWYRNQKLKERELTTKRYLIATVTIQKWYKNCRETKMMRESFFKQKRSVIRIEEWYIRTKLSKTEREKFLKIQSSVICLQKNFRCWRARKTFKIHIKSIVIIQSVVRCWLQRRQFLDLKRAAVIVQKNYRMFKVIKFVRKLWAVIVLQRFFKGIILGRKERENFVRLKRAAIVIQKNYRMIRCRRKFEIRIVLHRMLRDDAACVIQTYTRGWIKTTRIRIYYLCLKWATQIVQKNCRMVHCRRRFLALRWSALIVQKNYRMRVSRVNFLNLKWAAVVVQKTYRANLCQKEFRVIKNCTVYIQKIWRATLQRKKFVRMKSAAILLQAVWRGYRERRNYLVVVAATEYIQDWFRGCLKMKIERDRFLAKKSAAIKIQSWYKGYLAVKKYKQIRRAVLGLQKFYRSRKVMILVCLRIWSIAVLQMHWRAVLAGRKERMNFLVLKYATIAVQSWFRMVVKRREFLQLKRAAIYIQNFWRKFSARRNFLLVKQAVLVIEEWFLACWEGRIIRQSYLIFKNSTIKVQAVWRGHRVRKRLEIEYEAAVVIQNWFLRCQLVRELRNDFLELRYHVIKMQALRRGSVARKNLFYMNVAAIAIQSFFRGWQQKTKYQMLRGGAIIIQRFWRLVQLKRILSDHYAIKNAAAFALQRFFKGAIIRKHFLFVRYYTIVIQSYVRGFLRRKKFLGMRASAIVIQRFWRSCILQRTDFTQYHIIRGAVIVIQSFVRGHLIRKKIRAGVIKRRCNFARTSKVYDHMISFKKWKEYHILRGAAITIQAWVRSWLIRRRLARIKMERVAAAIKIQALFRGTRTRRKLEKERCVCWKFRCNNYVNFAHSRRLKMLNAVRVIERCYQRYKVRQMEYMNELELKRRTSGFSKWTKTLLAQRRWFLLMKMAAGVIQSSWRNWMEERILKRRRQLLMTGIVKFQAVARGYLVRRMFRRTRVHVKRKLKRLHPGRKEFNIVSRENYLKCFAAAAKLQLSAIRLQRWVRKCYVRKINRSAATIQSAWRGYKLRCKISDRRVSDARSRIAEVNQSAVLENTLWNRTTAGLDSLFNCRKLSTVWKALNHLNTSTRLSAVCCERLANSGGISIIFQLIEGCNRSVPHMEVIIECLCILVNLAKHEPCRSYVWQSKGSAITIVKLMRHYFENNEKIVLKCSSLIWLLSRDKQCVKLFQRDELLKKCINNLCAAVSRRFQFRTGRTSPPKPSPRKRKTFPEIAFQPDWMLGQDLDREFVNYVKAFPLVIELMKSWL